jgi:hypothetical protein
MQVVNYYVSICCHERVTPPFLTHHVGGKLTTGSTIELMQVTITLAHICLSLKPNRTVDSRPGCRSMIVSSAVDQLKWLKSCYIRYIIIFESSL